MRDGQQNCPEADLTRGMHVLVADDEQSVRQLLRRILEAHGGTVHEAGDGREARAIAQREHIDLVISDLWMPAANGVELVGALHAMNCSAPVIVLSAHVTAATVDKLRGLGVSRILKKPVSLPVLLDAIRTAMQDGSAGSPGGSCPGCPSADVGSSGNPTVLVADDDDAIRDMVRSILTGAGYHVEQARDGHEAVERGLALNARLVLMDLNMPRMDGTEAIRTLRAASRDRFVVCLTGECTKREIDAALGAGALSCIRKPFGAHELLAEIRRIEQISAHRECLAEHERAGLSPPMQRADIRRRSGMRILAAALVTVLVAAAAVPIVAGWLRSVRRATCAATEKADALVNSMSRLEGYLQRDEARELDRDGH